LVSRHCEANMLSCGGIPKNKLPIRSSCVWGSRSEMDKFVQPQLWVKGRASCSFLLTLSGEKTKCNI
jgi:hypothetical protein